MAIEAILATEQQAIYSDNICNPYMTFNNAITYDFTSGIGNATIENSSEKTLIGDKSMKIRALTTSGCNFNGGDSFQFTIGSTGNHNIQFRAWKTDTNAIVNMVVKVWIEGALTAERTINVTMDSANDFQDNTWNLFTQSFNANAGDAGDVSFYFESDTADAIVYLDAFKIDANDQRNIAPSMYSNPTFLINKWSRIYDFDNTQLLFEDTSTPFIFEGTFESNCGNEILLMGVGFKPTRLNSFFTVNCNFLAKVPAGSNLHIDAILNINGTTYMGDTQFIQKPLDEFQYVNFVFNIPCNAEFLEFDGAVELIAKGNNIVISRRLLVVSEQVNSN